MSTWMCQTCQRPGTGGTSRGRTMWAPHGTSTSLNTVALAGPWEPPVLLQVSSPEYWLGDEVTECRLDDCRNLSTPCVLIIVGFAACCAAESFWELTSHLQADYRGEILSPVFILQSSRPHQHQAWRGVAFSLSVGAERDWLRGGRLLLRRGSPESLRLRAQDGHPWWDLQQLPG